MPTVLIVADEQPLPVSPRLNGIAVCRAIRGDPGLAGVASAR